MASCLGLRSQLCLYLEAGCPALLQDTASFHWDNIEDLEIALASGMGRSSVPVRMSVLICVAGGR